MKVFNIGLNKTGTTSLEEVYRSMGLNTLGWSGFNGHIFSQAREGKFDLMFGVAQGFEALSDLPWALYFEELATQFPDAKFVLSIRPEVDWISSIVRHTNRSNWKGHELIYGALRAEGHEEEYLEVYREHNRRAKEYFAGKENFLAFHVGEDPISRLEEFLGRSSPYKELPKRNVNLRIHGIQIPEHPVIWGNVLHCIKKGNYERSFVSLLGDALRTGDSYLELGGGIGVVSAFASKTGKCRRITTVEPSGPAIFKTHEINQVSDVSVVRAAVVPDSETNDRTDYHLARHYWANSTVRTNNTTGEVKRVPAVRLGDLLRTFSPDVLGVDIEGAEEKVLTDADLTGVRDIVLEMHSVLMGKEKSRALVRALNLKGFQEIRVDRNVHLFSRVGR